MDNKLLIIVNVLVDSLLLEENISSFNITS